MMRLRPTDRPLLTCLACFAVIATGCGGNDDDAPGSATEVLRGGVKIDGKRGLYVSCSGSGSPTVVLEAGDADTSDYYTPIVSRIARTTRTCVYDRANLGRSDPAPGPRGLRDLVGDLERLLDAAQIPGPYVLVGSSGGGYIAAGYALAHPRTTAGIVLFDTFAPDPHPPKEVIEETDPDHEGNVEQRDYLQVENDAWDARRRLGDIPVRIVTVDYGNIAESAAERRNVDDQRGWLVLSPSAKQIVVHTGHGIVDDDPKLASDIVLDVVTASRRRNGSRTPAG